MTAQVFGATLFGAHARLVRVEAQTGRGLSRTILSGMPDAVAREARERLPSALAAHGLEHPRGKVLFNLVPAQMPKQGLPLDLALATALLVADGQWPTPARDLLCVAELDLEGRLGPPSRGLLLAALAAAEAGGFALATAPSAAAEARLAPGVRVLGCEDLSQLGAWLRAGMPSAETTEAGGMAAVAGSGPAPAPGCPRLDDVRGQPLARQALILAALGRHPLWLQGPPGVGKSMLARRLPLLLEDLSPERALQVARVEAQFGPVAALPRRPPWRAPHVSASAQAILGGGTPLRPGELARAHGGVLFLDELPEFARPVLEGLRQPLEEREVRLQRAREWAVFPADLLLIAASNPCPCGFAGHPRTPCRCTEAALRRYRARISGPLQDRFDLFVQVGPVSSGAMEAPAAGPTDEEVLERLAQARALQAQSSPERGFGPAGFATLDQVLAAGVAPRARALLRESAEAMQLTGRGILRCLRVARSCADWAQRGEVGVEELQAALSFRMLPAAEEAATAPGLPRSLSALLQRARAQRSTPPAPC